MASINRRIATDGSETYRVGYRVTADTGKRVLRWTPTIRTAAGAAEMKELIERIGPDAALAILTRRTGRDTKTGAPLLSEHFERHLTLLEADVSQGTGPEYRRMAERTWLPRLGAMPLDAITREDVIEWVAWQRRQETHRSKIARAKAARHNDTCKPGGEVNTPKVQTYSPKSIKNAHGLLSSVLASAVESGRITKNVAKGIGLPSDAAEGEMEIFTEAEWVRFYAEIQPHYRPLTLFLIATGCRIGEATAVQAGDFDLDAELPTVRIRRAWKKGETGVYLGSPKSRRALRTIVLPPGLVVELRPLIAGKRFDDLAFTAVEGGRIPAHRFRERQWGRAMKKAGITKRLTPHSLRHTSASWQLTAGVPAQVVQHRLGHESLSTTSKVYAHLMTDAQAGAAAVTQRAISGSLPQIEA